MGEGVLSTAPIDYEACDRACVLMEEALDQLDKAGATIAAVHLDHAICLVPVADPRKPRTRLNIAAPSSK